MKERAEDIIEWSGEETEESVSEVEDKTAGGGLENMTTETTEDL